MANNNTLDRKQAKKDLDFCERFFVENLGEDFPDHLDMVVAYISNKISTSTVFKEKQILNDVVRKISGHKHIIAEEFQNTLKKHIRNQIENHGIIISNNNRNLTNEDLVEVAQSINNLKDCITNNAGDDLKKVEKYVHFLAHDNIEIFSENILAQSLSQTLRGVFSSVKSFCLAIDAFSIIWPDKIALHFQNLKQELDNLGIDKRMEDFEKNKSSSTQSKPEVVNSEHKENKETKEHKDSTPMNMFDNFSTEGVDLDAFLNALPPAPKIEKKDDSVLSFNTGTDIDINDLSILLSTAPPYIEFSKDEPSLSNSLEIEPDVNGDNSSDKASSVRGNNSTDSTSNAGNKNSSVKISDLSGNNSSVSSLGDIESLAQNSNIQVIVIKDGADVNSIVSGLKPLENGSEAGAYVVGNNQLNEGFSNTPQIDPEVAKEMAIKKIANDINKALLSQQRISLVDFHSLIKQELDIPDIHQNESQIVLFPKFIKSINNIQDKFLKVTPEIFNRTKIFKKSIFNEILQNKIFAENVNYYDIFVLRLMSRTYQGIYDNEHISIYQKLILFKTQLWVLKAALLDQSFWYFKDHPARLLFDFIINPELYKNKKLVEIFDSIIISIDAPKNIRTDFFVSLINNLKEAVINHWDEEKKSFSVDVKSIEKDESLIFAYSKVAEYAMTITKQTDYTPIKEFAEEVWAYKFVQKLSKMTSLTIFDLPDFTKVLPANMKAMLNQHLIVIDALITLANNTDGSKSQIEKLQKFINKANEGLGTLSYDLDIDPKITKTLFRFIKYKLDIISKTSNPILIQKSIEKIIPNELKFKKDVQSVVGENALYVKANMEILESKYELDKLFKINHWYSINEELLKLAYVSPRRDFYIFIDMDKQNIRTFNKPTLWELIKDDLIEDYTEQSLSLNILNFLLEYNMELTNIEQENNEEENNESEDNDEDDEEVSDGNTN